MQRKKQKIRNLAYGILTLGAMLSSGCEKTPVDPIEENYECIPSLTVTPKSGVSPLEVRVQAGATDRNGEQDIIFLEFNDGTRTINEEVDETFTYNESTVLSFSCKDGDMKEPRTILEGITVLQPVISQDINVNGVNIFYDLNTENLEEIQREILRTYDGITNVVLSDTLKTSSHSETFENMEKGNYMFIAKGRNVADTAHAYIENFVPTTDLNDLELILNEGDSITLALPQPSDLNPEDNPNYTNVVSLDGKTEPSLNGNNLKIKSLDGEIGNYELRIWFGNEEMGRDSVDVQGNTNNLLDVSGRLENNISNIGEQGFVNVYETNGSGETFLGQTQTDNSGNFSFRVNKQIQGNLKLESKLNTGIYPDSNFIRTIILPNVDTSGVLIRAHPYTSTFSDNGISREDFIIKHLEEMNPNYTRPDPTLINVEIVYGDPVGKGSFTIEEQDSLESHIRNDISCYIEGKQFNIQKDDSNSENHYWIENGKYLRPDTGWIVIAKDTLLQKGGAAYRRDWDGDNFVDAGKILLKFIYGPLTRHEMGHIYFGGGHSSLDPSLTLQNILGGSVLSQPGPIDCEAAYVVHEETWLPGESYSDMLGTGAFTSDTGETFIIDKLN